MPKLPSPRIKTPLEVVVSEIEAIRKRVDRRTATTRMKRVAGSAPEAPRDQREEPAIGVDREQKP